MRKKLSTKTYVMGTQMNHIIYSFVLSKHGPANKNLVLMVLAISEDSDKSMHICSLVRASASGMYKK